MIEKGVRRVVQFVLGIEHWNGDVLLGTAE